MRRMKAKAGRVIGSHKHTYDHYSILCTGLVKVEYDGGEVEWYESGDAITVPAGVEHRITAISDIVWFCIHGVDDADDVALERG
jgi:quercetin dioxygenase-like cupin family protein